MERLAWRALGTMRSPGDCGSQGNAARRGSRRPRRRRDLLTALAGARGARGDGHDGSVGGTARLSRSPPRAVVVPRHTLPRCRGWVGTRDPHLRSRGGVRGQSRDEDCTRVDRARAFDRGETGSDWERGAFEALRSPRLDDLAGCAIDWVPARRTPRGYALDDKLPRGTETTRGFGAHWPSVLTPHRCVHRLFAGECSDGRRPPAGRWLRADNGPRIRAGDGALEIAHEIVREPRRTLDTADLAAAALDTRRVPPRRGPRRWPDPRY